MVRCLANMLSSLFPTSCLDWEGGVNTALPDQCPAATCTKHHQRCCMWTRGNAIPIVPSPLCALQGWNKAQLWLCIQPESLGGHHYFYWHYWSPSDWTSLLWVILERSVNIGIFTSIYLKYLRQYVEMMSAEAKRYNFTYEILSKWISC